MVSFYLFEMVVWWILFFGAIPLTILAGSICPENGVLGFDDSGNAYCYLYERFSAKFLVGRYSIHSLQIC